MTRSPHDLLTVVSPLSLEAWYGQFCGAMADVMFVGEDWRNPVDLADCIHARAASGAVRILSGHDSLLRDWAVAQQLRSRGLIVHAQSGMASGAALDKILQKQLLRLAGVQVPKWGTSETRPPLGHRAVWKGRTSTQSRAICWFEEGREPPPDSYWESYTEGVEYSVVLSREQGRVVRFPAVWKGSVRSDLSPPWRRLRLVPSGAEESLLTEMDEIAIRIAELLDVWGFAEVEYIVNERGTPLVTDVNPRVCGTMRIVAMATNTKIFDPVELEQLTAPPASQYAGEIPYSGPSQATPTLVATSRLTCSGASPIEVFDSLSRMGFKPDRGALPEVWRAN